MNVLFVCKANVGRSQMAEAWFKVLSGHNAKSAGTHVYKNEGRGLHDYVLNCMGEMRCDLSGSYRKQLTHEVADWADRIYVMTDKRNLPSYVDESKVEFWRVGDPKGKSYEEHVKTRNKVMSLVEKLVREIG